MRKEKGDIPKDTGIESKAIIEKTNEIIEEDKSAKSKGKVAALEEDIKKTNAFMIGVVIVLLVTIVSIAIGLGGIIVDTYRSREGSYQYLAEKINQQNQKIELLIQKIDLQKVKK